MIKIKRFIHLFIIVMLAVILSGCGEKAVPVSGAALDLQARFGEAVDDSEDYSAANGTIRFESAAEPTSEASIINSEAIQESIVTSETTTDNITNTENNVSVADNTTKETLTETKISETIQEEQFVITPKGTRYHVKGCHTAKNISEYLTKEEAKTRGYEPCKICKP